MLNISTNPHMQTPRTTKALMADVVVALLPAAVAAVLFFGVDALRVILTSVAACVSFEWLACRYWLHTKSTTDDFSAVITGLLLAYNLPSTLPCPMILIGAFMAIIVAKICFGGLGKNIFNPALVGRVFLFISFPVQMTVWPKPYFGHLFSPDGQTAATPLRILKSFGAASADSAYTLADLPHYWEMFVGHTGGSIGEISALALLLGFVWLLWRRVITWHIPVFYLGTVLIMTSLLYAFTGNDRFLPLAHLLSGGLMLGAIFMATDYTTSPMTIKGQIIFAIGCGLLTVIIRSFSAYPEGVSFAVLIMNAFVPLIDKFAVQRCYGEKR
jgi:electron transport complex protein RnfD